MIILKSYLFLVLSLSLIKTYYSKSRANSLFNHFHFILGKNYFINSSNNIILNTLPLFAFFFLLLYNLVLFCMYVWNLDPLKWVNCKVRKLNVVIQISLWLIMMYLKYFYLWFVIDWLWLSILLSKVSCSL